MKIQIGYIDKVHKIKQIIYLCTKCEKILLESYHDQKGCVQESYFPNNEFCLNFCPNCGHKLKADEWEKRQKRRYGIDDSEDDGSIKNVAVLCVIQNPKIEQLREEFWEKVKQLED